MIQPICTEVLHLGKRVFIIAQLDHSIVIMQRNSTRVWTIAAILLGTLTPELDVQLVTAVSFWERLLKKSNKLALESYDGCVTLPHVPFKLPGALRGFLLQFREGVVMVYPDSERNWCAEHPVLLTGTLSTQDRRILESLDFAKLWVRTHIHA